jgi:hypothetical protein
MAHASEAKTVVGFPDAEPIPGIGILEHLAISFCRQLDQIAVKMPVD